MLEQFWNWITGRTAARRMVQEWMEKFPGKCMRCSYRQYGYFHCHTDTPIPEMHYCIETESISQGKRWIRKDETTS